MNKNMITREEIEEMKRLCEGATKGPWKPLTVADHCYPRSSDIHYDIFGIGPRIPVPYDSNSDPYIAQAKADAEFIASSRDVIPKLIETVEKLALALSYIKINGPGLSKEALVRCAEDFYNEVFEEET